MAINITKYDLLPVRRDKQVGSSSGVAFSGSSSGGEAGFIAPVITVSTLPPFGVPADKDEWVMYIA